MELSDLTFLDHAYVMANDMNSAGQLSDQVSALRQIGDDLDLARMCHCLRIDWDPLPMSFIESEMGVAPSEVQDGVSWLSCETGKRSLSRTLVKHVPNMDIADIYNLFSKVKLPFATSMLSVSSPLLCVHCCCIHCSVHHCVLLISERIDTRSGVDQGVNQAFRTPTRSGFQSLFCRSNLAQQSLHTHAFCRTEARDPRE